MQMEDVEKIRNSWGNKPCDHQNLEKEYHLGSATGDYVCKQCGCVGYGENWPEKEKMEANMKKKVREVEVEKYGSEGYKPKDKNLCLYKGDNSCESGSGDSLCEGNEGTKKIGDKEYVLCGCNKDDEV